MEEKEMVDLPSRDERNRLRHVVMTAEDKKLMTREEAGFVVTLVERFRSEIEKKIKQLHVLQGEISQLKSNEQIIINLIESMVAAAERDLARQATTEKLKAAREVQEKREKDLRKPESSSQPATDNVDVKDK
jgi:hypothetical protein